MFKFFRKIRHDLMAENKMKKYFKYAIGEIFLVVIGILIALAISNWNSKRLNENRNLALLAKLSKELDLNIDRCRLLDTTLTGFGPRLTYTDSILKILNKGVEIDDLDYLVRKLIFYVNDFNLNSSVFEELKNTGSLYAIGSDSLVTEIQNYYQLCERESFYNISYSDNVKERRNICYVKWNDFKYLYSKNPELAIKEHQWLFNSRTKDFILFRQYVDFTVFHSRLMQSKLRGIEEESKKLKTLVALERNQS